VTIDVSLSSNMTREYYCFWGKLAHQAHNSGGSLGPTGPKDTITGRSGCVTLGGPPAVRRQIIFKVKLPLCRSKDSILNVCCPTIRIGPAFLRVRPELLA